MPDVRNRQTDVRQKNRLMPPPIRGGSIITLSAAAALETFSECEVYLGVFHASVFTRKPVWVIELAIQLKIILKTITLTTTYNLNQGLF